MGGLDFWAYCSCGGGLSILFRSLEIITLFCEVFRPFDPVLVPPTKDPAGALGQLARRNDGIASFGQRQYVKLEEPDLSGVPTWSRVVRVTLDVILKTLVEKGFVPDKKIFVPLSTVTNVGEQ